MRKLHKKGDSIGVGIGPRPPTSPRANLIVVALPVLSEGEILLVQGIRESLAKLGNAYELMVLSGGYEASLRKLADMGRLAGAIGEFMSSSWLEAIVRHDVEIVQLGASSRKGVSSVIADFESMGEAAVAAFIDNGVQCIGYVGPEGPLGSLRLGEAFSQAGSRHGMQAARCGNFSSSLLRGFLKSLTLPAGLLCSSDHLAHLVLVAAREEGLRIPQDLAVIGVGNSRMESLQAGMGISSFELPLEEIGRQAGRLMVSLLQGNASTSESTIKATSRLHQRESSLRGGSGAERALAYLNSNPNLSISVGELARMAGMSRRSFETAVSIKRGTSPGAILKKMKRARAECLLLESGRPISEICRECGYTELAVFSAAFKRWTGKSPRDFRSASVQLR